jgi:hypothetical protein
MKRALLAALATLALVAGLGGTASAASPPASCQGLAASSLAGQPGAFAQERRDAFGQAAELGITPGALTSAFARGHEGSLQACFDRPPPG